MTQQAAQDFSADPSTQKFWAFCVAFSVDFYGGKITEWPSELYYQGGLFAPGSFWGSIADVKARYAVSPKAKLPSVAIFSSVREANNDITHDANLAAMISKSIRDELGGVHQTMYDFEENSPASYSNLFAAAVNSTKCIFILSGLAFKDPRFIAALLLASSGSIEKCTAVSGVYELIWLLPAFVRRGVLPLDKLTYSESELLILEKAGLLSREINLRAFFQ